MSEREEYHDSHLGEDSESEDVIFKEVVEEATSSTVLAAPPEIVTKSDLQEVIEEWKIKFQKLTEGVRGNGGHDPSQRPTHEDEHGNSGDFQQPPTNNNNSSGMNNSASRPSSSPKVPIFDGTVSAQFRPWIIQFEAIARHQCWTMGERVVQLVASLAGPAVNMLIGMTMGQLDDYAFLVAHLSRRYDPPEREEAHRAELRARTRRRNETADEFAENLKNLAQRAYTNADQNMLDNLVVERFREGHGNMELKKHLCLYYAPQLDYRT